MTIVATPETISEASEPQADAPPPSHIKIIDGERHRRDAKGRWTLESMFDVKDLLMEDMVRDVVERAEDHRENLAEFRVDMLARAESFNDLLAQEYGAPRGGEKGNMTFSTIDQMMRFQVRVNDILTFGPELQQAKALIDECLQEWSADSRAEIRTLVMRAFDVGKEGKINQSEILMLTRLDIEDHRWKQAVRAIKDSIRSEGTKISVRFEKRDGRRGRWIAIPLDVARA